MVIPMTPEQALVAAKKAVGGAAVIARALDISIQAVCQWRTVPPQYVLTLEKLSRRKVKKHQLRPDIYPPPRARPRANGVAKHNAATG
jgi:DNA-binding transcriptional regulator YdaS (Cro superfamily)